jgi:hypothetical protein
MQSSRPAGYRFSGASLYEVETIIIGTRSAISRATSVHHPRQVRCSLESGLERKEPTVFVFDGAHDTATRVNALERFRYLDINEKTEKLKI